MSIRGAVRYSAAFTSRSVLVSYNGLANIASLVRWEHNDNARHQANDPDSASYVDVPEAFLPCVSWVRKSLFKRQQRGLLMQNKSPFEGCSFTLILSTPLKTSGAECE